MNEIIQQIARVPEILIGYLVIVNMITFFIYGVDKRKAEKHLWRIPEANLIGLAILGGSVGAFFAMKTFRHKTKHAKFFVGVPVIFMIQVIVSLLIIIKF